MAERSKCVQAKGGGSFLLMNNSHSCQAMHVKCKKISTAITIIIEIINIQVLETLGLDQRATLHRGILLRQYLINKMRFSSLSHYF